MHFLYSSIIYCVLTGILVIPSTEAVISPKSALFGTRSTYFQSFWLTPCVSEAILPGFLRQKREWNGSSWNKSSSQLFQKDPPQI